MKFTDEKYPSLKEFSDLPNICYIAYSVRDSVIRSSSKLRPLINQIKSTQRTILLDPPKAATYKMANVNGEVSFEMLFHTGKFWLEGKIKEDGSFSLGVRGTMPPNFDTRQFHVWLESCFYIELFLQYADIETKILPRKEQIWDKVTCLYNNKTDKDITVIDSTWFTNLVKSDAFKVRGHFRLQPCGHELKDKKLIWINEFQKEGYTREAKIISEYPATADQA